MRRLLQFHERRNGVRLWCSVRRSGKTTASITDLGSTGGRSIVAPQTCESTGQVSGGDVFYKAVRGALDEGRRLPDDFVQETVKRCLPSAADAGTRIVLVLDEYETLFGDLQSSYLRQRDLRYSVVQPLLNQLVAFSRDNLLIFMGQQPNAHFILLDQNQLSPLVEQDSFPLFPYDSAVPSTGEFFQLMSRVMTAHVELDPAFVARVYQETSGHPFLTVMLLRSFMDWLIDERRLMSELMPVQLELFEDYLSGGITRSSIAKNPHYFFFRGIASEHLSVLGRETEPWLGAVYGALRSIGLDSSESLAISLDDFTRNVARDTQRVDPDELLATASRANFLEFDQNTVRPRIPLLARIAASVVPR